MVLLTETQSNPARATVSPRRRRAMESRRRTVQDGAVVTVQGDETGLL
jgi:hypothetical protein